MCKKLGFQVHQAADEAECTIEMNL
jgi:hypothetical protein